MHAHTYKSMHTCIHTHTHTHTHTNQVVETDILYTLMAGVIQEHGGEHHTGVEVIVYTLTRRVPPGHLKFDQQHGLKFVSFSRVRGEDAAAIIRSHDVDVLYDLTTYGDFTGAHV